MLINIYMNNEDFLNRIEKVQIILRNNDGLDPIQHRTPQTTLTDWEKITSKTDNGLISEYLANMYTSRRGKKENL